MNIVDLLASNSYIVVNKQIAMTVGLNEALVLGELAGQFQYWRNNGGAKDGWFYSTNENLTERLPFSEMTIRRAVNRLVELGYVETKLAGLPAKKHYRLRLDKLLDTDCSKMNEQVCSNRTTKNNILKNISTKVDSETSPSEAVENSTKQEYGNHEVNALLELWEHETGLTANVAKANRLAAYNLLRRKGFDGAKKVIEMCGRAVKSGDQYAPRVASFKDLQGQYEKLSKLEAWDMRRAKQNKTARADSFYRNESTDIQEISDAERELVSKQMREARERLGFIKK